MGFDGFCEVSRDDPSRDIPIHITLFSGADALGPGVTGILEVSRPQTPPNFGFMQKIIQALGGLFFSGYTNRLFDREQIIYVDVRHKFNVQIRTEGTSKVNFEVHSEVLLDAL